MPTGRSDGDSSSAELSHPGYILVCTKLTESNQQNAPAFWCDCTHQLEMNYNHCGHLEELMWDDFMDRGSWSQCAEWLESGVAKIRLERIMPERSWSPWLWQAGFVFSGNLIAYWFCGDWCCSSCGDFCYSLTFSVLSQAGCPFLLQWHHNFCWEGFPAFWSGSRACLLRTSWLHVNLWLFLEPCFRPATHPGHLCAEFECSKGDLNIFCEPLSSKHGCKPPNSCPCFCLASGVFLQLEPFMLEHNLLKKFLFMSQIINRMVLYNTQSP